MVQRDTSDRISAELGQTFEFEPIAPGSYTLLAASQPGGTDAKLWVLPIDVQRSVEIDLEMSTARDGTFEGMLEDLLLRPQRFSAA